MIQTIHFTRPVPYVAQIASPELADAVFARGMDPALDSRWADSGAKTMEEYVYWTGRACGVACLKMCVEALGGPSYPLLDWAREGVRRGAYLIRTNEDGQEEEVGWVHSGLAAMARKAGLHAEARGARLDEILSLLRTGHLLIASVSFELGDDRLPITKKGGHLVVVTGAEYDAGGPLVFFIHNPSGRRSELQAGARIDAQRFAAGYAGRIVEIHA